MDKVIECTRALGEAITASPAFAEMKLAEDGMAGDPAAAAYRERLDTLKTAHLQAVRSGNGDAAVIYAEMEDLQRLLSELPSVSRAMKAREAFSELMNRVNQVLEFAITGEVRENGGCSGSCSTCPGCAASGSR